MRRRTLNDTHGSKPLMTSFVSNLLYFCALLKKEMGGTEGGEGGVEEGNVLISCRDERAKKVEIR